MTDLTQATYAGPALHKTEDTNPSLLMLKLIKKDPKASRDTLVQRFADKVLEDEDLSRVCALYFGWHAFERLHAQQRSVRRADPDRERCVAENVSKLRAVVISELLMPNGKKLCDCTGVEMMKFGGLYTEIGKIAGRKKVGVILSERQLQKMWKAA